MLSLYFNDVKIPEWIKVTNIKEDILNLDVSKEKSNFKEKSITIEFSFRRNKLIDIEKRYELVNWIKGDNFKESKLVLPDRLNYYYMAKVSNLSEITGSIKKGSGSIVFTCFKTDYIDSRVDEITLNNSIERKIYYRGTSPAYPDVIFNILSACSKIKLSFNNNHKSGYIELNGSFNRNDIIKFNQSTNKILVNNRVNMPILHLKSKRLKLEHGFTNFQLETGNVEAKIIWNDKYL